MKIVKTRNFFLLSGAALLLATTSCEKYVDINTPPNAVGKEQAISDSTTATSVVLSLYSNAVSGNSSDVFLTSVYGAMSADEGYYLTNTSYDNFRTNTLAAGNAANSYWSNLYARIGKANYAIEGLSAATTLPVSVKNQLLGEAKFWRAWLYFYLVNYFGDTPLVLTTDALTNGLLPRASVANVYQQIVTDLTDAKGLLTNNYPSTERARVNQNAASAFLARVYFYQQHWTAAESEATNVINNGTYSLVTNLDNVFLNNSNETIWQLSLLAASTPATVFATEFIPASTTPSFVLYDTLTNTFEPNDQRKAKWTKSIVYLGKTYYYPYKYKVRSTITGNEYPVMIRLAEMYLIRAEARANQNNVSGGVGDINLVRQRAGITQLSAALSKDALLAALEHERWVELFTESSDRWFNLKRLNKATSVLSLLKPSWQPFQQLYPIPQQAMTANPNLKDNPGY